MTGNDSMAPAPQQRVGSFVLLDKLGEGGLGEVWKARDHRLNRVVALKFIRSTAKSSHDLAHEARAASALNHPNIVTILEIGESAGATYVAMEFVEGETLRSRIDKSKVPFDRALDIVRQMAQGLGAAHKAGIVHRDVKPENVMLRMDGYVKLVDFGLAKVLPWSDSVTNAGVTDGTESGQIVGTFSYMSPEQARGQPVDATSDIFSLGIVLYELLTGEHPFRTDNPMDTLQGILNREPVSTRVKCPEISGEMHGIVERCLKKDKSQRFPSGADLEEELKRLSATASPATTTGVSKKFKTPVVVSAALSAILAIALVIVNPFRSPAPAAKRTNSIAVMNFRTAKDDFKATSFAIGLSEDLGDALSKQGFLVASRSSVEALADRPGTRGASVDTVLEGSVTSSGEAFRVHVELIAPQTSFQVWSGTFTSKSGDPLTTEAGTAGEIAAKLKEAAAQGNWDAQTR